MKVGYLEFGRRLGTRTSTALKTSETIKIMKQREAESKRKRLKLKKKQKVERKMTQEEILKEAKITEKMNLESLKKYEEMELENKRKAIRSGARSVKGPAIRYQSLSMPVIQELKPEETEVKEEAPEEDSKENVKNKRQERTFISFTDDSTLRQNFPKSSSRVPSSKICPVTRLPAKYFDPVTELPYANLQAFKIIREAYYQQLETRGDKTDPEVASWLSWREKNKPAKPILVSVNRPPQAFTNLATGQQRQPGIAGGNVKTNSGNVIAAGASTQVTPAPATASPNIAAGSKQPIMLPTRPVPIPSTQTPAVNTAVPAVKLPVSPAVAAGAGRTIATTTLTAAQLQQLAAARGQVFVQGAQVRGAGVAAAGGGTVRQLGGPAAAGRASQIVRQGGQTSLIVSQQPRQALAVQRPGGQIVQVKDGYCNMSNL